MKKVCIVLIMISSQVLISADNHRPVDQQFEQLALDNRPQSGTITPPTTGTPAQPPALKRQERLRDEALRRALAEHRELVGRIPRPILPQRLNFDENSPLEQHP